MATKVSVNIKYLLAKGEINLATNEVHLIFMASGYVFDEVNHDKYADISASELPTANGYTVGGFTLTGAVVARDDVNKKVTARWDNVTGTATGGDITSPCALLVNWTHSDKPIISAIIFEGGNQTAVDGQPIVIKTPGVDIGA